MKKYFMAPALLLLVILVIGFGMAAFIISKQSAVVSIFSSITVALFILVIGLLLQGLLKPDLSIEVDSTQDKAYERFETSHHIYLRVRVTNWIQASWLVRMYAPYIPFQPAMLCEAKLVFLDRDGYPIFFDRKGRIAVMQGRWSYTAEPRGVHQEITNGRDIDEYPIDKVNFHHGINIPYGSYRLLDVVMRGYLLENDRKSFEKECHGWHNSYIAVQYVSHQERNHNRYLCEEDRRLINFDLNEGEFLVLIAVRASGVVSEKILRIVNLSSENLLSDSFSLEEGNRRIEELPNPKEVYKTQVESNLELKEAIDSEVRRRMIAAKAHRRNLMNKDFLEEVIDDYLDVRKAALDYPTADEVVHRVRFVTIKTD